MAQQAQPVQVSKAREYRPRDASPPVSPIVTAQSLESDGDSLDTDLVLNQIDMDAPDAHGSEDEMPNQPPANSDAQALMTTQRPPPSPSASNSVGNASDTHESFIDVEIINQDVDYRPSVVQKIEHEDPLLSVTIDRYGFPTSEKIDQKQHRKKVRKENERLLKWQRMLYRNRDGEMHKLSSTDVVRAQIQQWNEVKGSRKLKPRIRKGIPPALRATVWQNLCGARERRAEECKKAGTTRIYRDFVEMDKSPYHEQLWKDINRTYRNQVRFGMVGVSKMQRQASRSKSSAADANLQMRSSPNIVTKPQSPNDSHTHTKSGGLPKLNELDQLEPARPLSAAKSDPNAADEAKHDDSIIASVQSLPVSRPKPRKPKTSNVFHKDVIQDSEVIITPKDLERHATDAQKQLYHVLKAFSLYRKDIGYCQGMQSIAALMLMQMTEEETFWVLASLADDSRYQMEWLWRPNMPGIHLRFYQMERLVRIFLPKLAKHFEDNGIISASMYQASQWFITIFLATSMNFDTILRVWDIYLNEGLKTVFRMGLGILKYYQKELLAAEFEDMVEMFREGTARVDVEEYINTCFSIKVTHSQLVALEKQYNQMQSKQNQRK